MRGGLIAVGGAGDFVGVNLLAGTILVFGECGIRPGPNMHRGTIVLFGEEPPKLLPTFRRACRYRPPFLPLIAAELARLGYDARGGLVRARGGALPRGFGEPGCGEVMVG